MRTPLWFAIALAMLPGTAWISHASAADAEPTLAPVTERFAKEAGAETPDFQRHVMPLLGTLGCNGRSCHGSFQGAGDFRLSLFGYDFKADYEALNEEFRGRVNADAPLESLIWAKPTSSNPDDHEGGQRYTAESWEGHLLRSWLEAGAKFDTNEVAKLTRLEITPSEVVFSKVEEQQQLKVVAVWADGTREDVTPLCRFTTNNEQIAAIDSKGLIVSGASGDTHVVVAYDKGVVPVPVIQPVTKLVGKDYPAVETPTRVDELVVEKLRKLGVVPSDAASDAEFLRRLRLDMTGTLPSPTEVADFLADTSANKRSEKINQLLETPEYAAWWTTKLCDFTGNNAEALNNVTPIRDRAGNEWWQWIYQRIADNRPYDEIAAGIVMGTSRDSGESYTEYCESMSKIQMGDPHDFAARESMPYYWARRDIRMPEDKTIAFAYSFMGMRIQCAQCHKHPFDVWSKEDFDGFKAFFTHIVSSNNSAPDARDEYNEIMKKLGTKDLKGNDLRRKIADFIDEGKTIPFGEVFARAPVARNPNARAKRPASNSSTTATLLGGEVVDLTKYDDPREPIVEWLRDKENAYLARAFVNRVWASYFNVGIVEPPDDLSLGNPPSNKPLLDYLTYGFLEHNYDMKWLHREIANSRTYQTTWKPNDTNRLDERNFSRSVPRRLPAEVAYDAIKQATLANGDIETFQDEMDKRAISVATANYRNQNNGSGYALMVFGRSSRDSNCDCDRSNETSLLQTVFLQNDRDVLSMIDQRNSSWVDQVRKEYGGEGKASSASNDSAPADYSKRYAAQKRKLEQLRKAGKTKEAEQVANQLRKFKQRFGDPSASKPAEEAAPEKPAGEELVQEKAQELVNQAYLRTVSRYPTKEELNESVKYMAAAPDAAAGARDLLWALLNTKEFIVNH